MPPRPKTIGDYEILAPLSTGTHSELYAVVRSDEGAQHGEIRVLRRLVDPGAAELLRALKSELEPSPGTAEDVEHVRDVFLHEGRLCLVSDFIEGETLQNFLRAEPGPLSPKLTVTLVAAIAKAVIHGQRGANTRGVHGDLCPANVMLTYDGRVVVREFALALYQSEVDPGSIPIGDLRFMAPERIKNPRAAEKSVDVYSLGLILYRMLTGQPAISGENPRQLLAAATKPRFAKPSSIVKCWGSLEKLILSAASPEIGQRPSGMEEVERTLAEVISSRMLQSGSDGELPRLITRHFQHRAKALGTMKKRWRSQGGGESESAEPKVASPRAPRAISSSARGELGFELIGLPTAPRSMAPLPSRPAPRRAGPAALSATFLPDLGAPEISTGDLPFRDLASRDLPFVSAGSRDLPTGDVAAQDTGEFLRPRLRLSFGVGVMICLTLSLALSASVLYLPPDWRRFVVAMAEGFVETFALALERLVTTLDS